MDQNELQKFRRQLESLANRVGADAAALAEQTHSPSGGNGGSELSNAPFHLGDMGTEEFLYDLNATLLTNEQYLVSESREALRRIEGGSFGVCESCEAPIPRLRLEAIPYTRHCVKCAESSGGTPRGTPEVNYNEGRPQSPRDTLAPEGEMSEDRRRVDDLEFSRPPLHRGDIHAAGTAGGGTPVGGLAGSTEGYGDPVIAEVDEATASSYFDMEDDRTDRRIPLSGPSGGAVGGTPVFKRAK